MYAIRSYYGNVSGAGGTVACLQPPAPHAPVGRCVRHGIRRQPHRGQDRAGEPVCIGRLGHRRLQGDSGRRRDTGLDDRQRPATRLAAAVPARALRKRVSDRRRGGLRNNFV